MDVLNRGTAIWKPILGYRRHGQFRFEFLIERFKRVEIIYRNVRARKVVLCRIFETANRVEELEKVIQSFYSFEHTFDRCGNGLRRCLVPESSYPFECQRERTNETRREASNRMVDSFACGEPVPTRSSCSNLYPPNDPCSTLAAFSVSESIRKRADSKICQVEIGGGSVGWNTNADDTALLSIIFWLSVSSRDSPPRHRNLRSKPRSSDGKCISLPPPKISPPRIIYSRAIFHRAGNMI